MFQIHPPHQHDEDVLSKGSTTQASCSQANPMSDIRKGVETTDSGPAGSRNDTAAQPLVSLPQFEAHAFNPLEDPVEGGQYSQRLRFNEFPEVVPKRHCSSPLDATSSPPQGFRSIRSRKQTPFPSPEPDEEDNYDFLDIPAQDCEDSDPSRQHEQHRDEGLWGRPTQDGYSNWCTHLICLLCYQN
jgi:hypothetical protein